MVLFRLIALMLLLAAVPSAGLACDHGTTVHGAEAAGLAADYAETAAPGFCCGTAKCCCSGARDSGLPATDCGCGHPAGDRLPDFPAPTPARTSTDLYAFGVLFAKPETLPKPATSEWGSIFSARPVGGSPEPLFLMNLSLRV